MKALRWQSKLQIRRKCRCHRTTSVSKSVSRHSPSWWGRSRLRFQVGNKSLSFCDSAKVFMHGSFTHERSDAPREIPQNGRKKKSDWIPLYLFCAQLQLWCYGRCTHSKTPPSTFLPTRVFLAVASSPHSQQHLSSSTFKYFNLRESQYARREQAERLSWGQFETESLLKHFACTYLLSSP